MTDARQPVASDAALGLLKRHQGIWIDFAVYLASAALLAAATLLLTVATPAADDYCRATVSAVADYLVHIYLTHTGRWFSIGILAPVILGGVDLYRLYAVLLLALWLTYPVAFFLTVVGLARVHGRELGVAAGAVLLVWAVWLGGLPSPGQTVYWFSGGLEYGLSFSLLVVVVAAVAIRLSQGRAERPLFYAGAGAAILALSGLHELAAMTGFVTLVTGLVLARLNRGRFVPVITFLSVLALVGLLVSAAAPGNAARAGRFDHSHGLGPLVYSVYLQFFSLVVPWLTDPRILAASVLLVTDRRFLRLSPRCDARALRWLKLAFPVLTACLVGGCLLAAAVIQGGVGPGRLHNLAYSFFILGWFCSLFVWTRYGALEGTPNRILLRGCAGGVLILALLFAGNGERIIDGLTGSGNLLTWRAEESAVIEVLRTAGASPDAEVRLQSYPAPPDLFGAGFARAPTSDSEHFINRCMADFYELEALRVEESR